MEKFRFRIGIDFCCGLLELTIGFSSDSLPLSWGQRLHGQLISRSNSLCLSSKMDCVESWTVVFLDKTTWNFIHPLLIMDDCQCKKCVFL